MKYWDVQQSDEIGTYNIVIIFFTLSRLYGVDEWKWWNIEDLGSTLETG